MVHILSHEGAAQGVPLILEEMATESSFIAENGDNIPAGRGPLVNTSGRALAATQGRGARGATTSRARGARGTSGGRGARGATGRRGVRGAGRSATNGAVKATQ